MTDADLTGPSIGLTDSQLQAAANVAGIILAGLDLSGWDLSGLDLSNADLSGADLSGSVLSGATLTDADLTGSVGLTDSQLRAAVSIEGIILAGLDLSGWNLSVLNLSGVDLRNANLAGANLSLSALIAADLRGADLRGANLYGAFWLNTDVRGADFGGADLSGSPSLINAIAGYTFYSSATHFDPGFDPVAAGWTLFGLLWEQKISDTQGGFTGVLDNSDCFGESVAALGDLDGDGVGDLAVGSAWDDDGGDAVARCGCCSSTPTARSRLTRRSATPRAASAACSTILTCSAGPWRHWGTWTATVWATWPWEPGGRRRRHEPRRGVGAVPRQRRHGQGPPEDQHHPGRLRRRDRRC